MTAAEKRSNVMEMMRCLRRMCGVTRMDRGRNENVRKRTGVTREVAGRVQQRVFRWFGHLDKIRV